MSDAGSDLETFARDLERSRLVRAGEAARLVARQPSAADAAEHLVATGTLTPYQAKKLLTGRWQGLVLGPYHILKPIGRGGMGIVYRAARADSADSFALKILPPKKAVEEPRSLARFKREMRIGRLVPPHPNVVRTVDAGAVNGVYFLAMEYVSGRTLKHRVAKHGPVPPAHAARLFARAAAGLVAVHAAGVVHRDVSPGNLILTPTGDVKLLDFGVAIVVGEPLPADPTVAGGVGYTMGTMDYIAPEQVRDAGAATPASDLYALGCSLYFAVTGSPPYPGGDARQKLRWHEQVDAPPAVSINPLVPAELSHLIERLMAKAPSDRPGSAAELGRELQALVPADEPPPAVALPPSEPDVIVEEESADEWHLDPATPNRMVWALIAFFGVILAGLIGVLVVLLVRQ